MLKMSFLLTLSLSLISVIIFDTISCAPIEDDKDQVAEELPESRRNSEEPKEADFDDKSKIEGRQASTASPVKEWFENLSKNVSTNTQNSLNDLQKWFAGLSGNSDTNNPFANIMGNGQNSPVMILGSYQALKIPVPQFSDIIKGMGNMAMAAQGVNKLFGKTK